MDVSKLLIDHGCDGNEKLFHRSINAIPFQPNMADPSVSESVQSQECDQLEVPHAGIYHWKRLWGFTVPYP